MPMRVVRFVHRVTKPHWQAIVIGVIVIAASVLGGTAIIQNGREKEDQARQFCTAIPNASAASAQALVDVLAADAVRRHESRAAVTNIRTLGALYVHRARVRALSYLPSCPKEAP